MRRVWLGVGAVFVLGAWLGACSSAGRGSASSSTGPATSVVQGTILKVADFPAAVAAVEAARGGPQQLVEVNATPDGVNVFAAADADPEVAYFYEDGTLQAPGAAGADLVGAVRPHRHRPRLGQHSGRAHAAAVPRGHRRERGPRPTARRWAALGLALPVAPRRPAQRALHADGELVSVAPAQEPAG